MWRYGKIADTFSYAQVSDANRPFEKRLAPPHDFTLLPFRMSNQGCEEELVELVDFIRSAPDVPVARFSSLSGNRVVYRPLDTSLPMYSIRSSKSQIDVIMGMIEAGLSGATRTYTCERTGGMWKIIKHHRTIY